MQTEGGRSQRHLSELVRVDVRGLATVVRQHPPENCIPLVSLLTMSPRS